MESLTDKFKTSRKHLTNVEHLSFVIGTGTDKDLKIANDIMKSVSYSLHNLGKLTMLELAAIKGVTKKKAAAVLAAMELGVRRQGTPMSQRIQITRSEDSYKAVLADLMDLSHEEFIVLLLSQSNKIIDKVFISVGGLSGTVVDVRKIYRAVIANPLCAGIILAHNHPSDNLNPSRADIEITAKIKEAGKLMDIMVLDHIIVAGNSYTSFVDEGLL